MGVYRQEMAAIVCVFDSGEVTIISTHRTRHEAMDAYDLMCRSGEVDSWMGRVRVLCCGACHAELDLSRLEA